MKTKSLVLVLSLLASIPGSNEANDYDPLDVAKQDSQEPIDLEINDSERKRKIPIRVFQPKKKNAAVILFSHGLGGSRRGCRYLGEHWSKRGFAVIFMQHAGSDEAVWRDLPARDRLQALKSAPSAKNTVARFLDVKVVLDHLEKWNKAQDHRFHGRFDLETVGMSGHSYGASTTQGVSGQSAPRLGQRYTDKRIDAAIMFSPNIPKRSRPDSAFGKVTIPWMLMTGTKDTSQINDTTVDDRRQVYPALPKTIDKYELVLFEGEHHAFSDGGSTRRTRKRNPKHHPTILALSTAFWEAHLLKNQRARGWLHGDGAKMSIDTRDQWQINTIESKKSHTPN